MGMIDTNITITASVTTKMSCSFYHVMTITTIAANTNVDNSTNITNVVMSGNANHIFAIGLYFTNQQLVMETKANPEVSNTLIPSTKTLGSFSIGCWIIAEQKLRSKHKFTIYIHYRVTFSICSARSSSQTKVAVNNSFNLNMIAGSEKLTLGCNKHHGCMTSTSPR